MIHKTESNCPVKGLEEIKSFNFSNLKAVRKKIPRVHSGYAFLDEFGIK